MNWVFILEFLFVTGAGRTPSSHNLPSVWDLARHAGLDPANLDAVAAYIASNPKARVDVDVPRLPRNGALSQSRCIFYTPTYYVRIESKELATAFLFNDSAAVMFTLEPSTVTSRSESVFTSKLRDGTGHVIHESTKPRELGKRGFSKMWIHIEKNGGSFAPTAASVEYAWVGHASPPKDAIGGCDGPGVDPDDRCRLISLFREPSQRTISWFYYSRYSRRCIQSAVTREDVLRCLDAHLKTTNMRLEAENSYLTQLREKKGFVGAPNLWACYCKVLLGYHCEDLLEALPSDMRSSRALYDRAKAVLKRDYDFVATTDDFDASVTLAHQILGGQLDLNSAFLRTNTREHVGHFPRAIMETHDALDKGDSLGSTQPPPQAYAECEGNPACENEPDTALYQEVRRWMFRAMLAHHDQPIRIVDTSRFSSDLRAPRETNQMAPSKPYARNLTRVLAQAFGMPDSTCERREAWH